MYPPLSKQKLKLFQKLNYKKYRNLERMFIVSGLRGVKSIASLDPKSIKQIVIEEKGKYKDSIFKKLQDLECPINTLEISAFKKLTEENSPQGICAIVTKPDTIFNIENIKGIALFLEHINDPGNLGTIIRSAEWFGCRTMLLSPESADPFQPKAVRATAGAISAVQIFENVTDAELLELKKSGYTFLATDSANGENVHTVPFNKKSLIMVGSEAHGLSGAARQLSDLKITIPGSGQGESLNLANAAAIVLYQAFLNSENKG